MKKYYLLMALLFCIFTINAQYLEVGMQGGVSNYQGDLAPQSLWNSVGQSHAVVGGFMRYNFNKRIAARLALTHGTISGSDHTAVDEGRRRRNLDFTSRIQEIALTGEFNLFGYTPSNLFADFSPYVFTGIALFHFNPQTEYIERWIDLNPLGTEGQGMPGYAEKYKLTQISIPIGGGLKYNIAEQWTVALELGARKTFTDHLDDVGGKYVHYKELLRGNGSEAAALGNRIGEYMGTDPVEFESGTIIRGNPENKDWYLFGTLTISYNFVYKGIYTSSFNSRHLGCPRKF